MHRDSLLYLAKISHAELEELIQQARAEMPLHSRLRESVECGIGQLQDAWYSCVNSVFCAIEDAVRSLWE